MPQDDILGRIEIAAPCSVSWDSMSGDERTRMCASCNKHVYNLSAMSKPAAEKLILDTQGSICVRFFKRADGTVMTDNCPIGLKALRRQCAIAYGAIAAAIAFIIGLPLISRADNRVLQGKPMMGEPMMGGASVQQAPQKKVVFFTKKVKAGQLIKAEDVEIRDVAECKVVKTTATDASQLVGRKAKHNILPGEIARTTDTK